MLNILKIAAIAAFGIALGASSPALATDTPQPLNDIMRKYHGLNHPADIEPAAGEEMPADTESVVAPAPMEEGCGCGASLLDAIMAAEEQSDMTAISARLDIMSVPRFYEVRLFGEGTLQIVRVNDTCGEVIAAYNDSDLSAKKSHILEKNLEAISFSLVEAVTTANYDERGIPIVARLKTAFDGGSLPQPVFEITIRHPRGNDEITLIDGASGEMIEWENYE